MSQVKQEYPLETGVYMGRFNLSVSISIYICMCIDTYYICIREELYVYINI